MEQIIKFLLNNKDAAGATKLGRAVHQELLDRAKGKEKPTQTKVFGKKDSNWVRPNERK